MSQIPHFAASYGKAAPTAEPGRPVTRRTHMAAAGVLLACVMTGVALPAAAEGPLTRPAPKAADSALTTWRFAGVPTRLSAGQLFEVSGTCKGSGQLRDRVTVNVRPHPSATLPPSLHAFSAIPRERSGYFRGKVAVPEDFPAGNYQVSVTACDGDTDPTQDVIDVTLLANTARIPRSALASPLLSPAPPMSPAPSTGSPTSTGSAPSPQVTGRCPTTVALAWTGFVLWSADPQNQALSQAQGWQVPPEPNGGLKAPAHAPSSIRPGQYIAATSCRTSAGHEFAAIGAQPVTLAVSTDGTVRAITPPATATNLTRPNQPAATAKPQAGDTTSKTSPSPSGRSAATSDPANATGASSRNGRQSPVLPTAPVGSADTAPASAVHPIPRAMQWVIGGCIVTACLIAVAMLRGALRPLRSGMFQPKR